MDRGSGKILILDRGNVELVCPSDWTVEPHPSGYVTLRDPKDLCKLEVSYLRLPLVEGLPPLEERLHDALQACDDAAGATVESATRGPARVAVASYAYEATDEGMGGERLPACGRWALVANQLFQALLTFYHWADDTAWAVPTWQRILESVTLGDGSQLASPRDHWAMRNPS